MPEQVARDELRARAHAVDRLALRALEDAALDAAPPNLLAGHVGGDSRDPGIERTLSAKTMDGSDKLDERELGHGPGILALAPRQTPDGRVDRRARPAAERG